MHFKECPKCEWIWELREHLLSDPHVSVVGYQVNFKELEEGYFIFQHTEDHCGTSFAVRAGEFTDLYNGPLFVERMTETEKCPEYCLFEEELGRCMNQCECAYVREVLQMVRSWPKSA